MNICLINLDYKPYRSSGLSIYGELLAEGLANKGHRVSMICSKGKGLPHFEIINKVHIYRVGPSRFHWIHFSMLASQKIKELKKTEKFDIIHFLDVHFSYATNEKYIATLLQSFRQRLTADNNRPYHTTSIDLIKRYFLYKFCKFLELYSLNRSKYLIAVSESTRDEFIENYQIPPEKIKKIYIGIKPHKISITTHNFKKDLGIKNDELVLLYVGFSNPRKGLEYLVSAINRVGSKVKLLIVGKWESGYREKIIKLVRDNNKIIITDYVNDRDIWKYYSVADIYVQPSLLEGFGISIVEAMCAGIPIICTNAGSLPEIVGRAGIVVPKGNTPLIIKAINTLAKNSRLRKKIGLLGKERAELFFTQTRMVNRTENVYKRFIESEGNIL